MAISLQIYNNVYNLTKTVAVDFIANVATFTNDPSADDTPRYFFKFTTGARDTNNLPYSPRVVADLSDLALNGNVQSASNVSAAYSNVKAMIIDYAYDYINGHTADQFGSGCTAKAPMKFST